MARFVRLSVSGETSAVNVRLVFLTTVRQAPFTAMLPPSSIGRNDRLVLTDKLADFLPSRKESIVPTSSIRPVNMLLTLRFDRSAVIEQGGRALFDRSQRYPDTRVSV